jgi:hypothetical protein
MGAGISNKKDLTTLHSCYFHISFIMSGPHFYLMLPSNASLNVFPNNKTTEYHVQLPQAVDLEGDWKVGVYSLSYPHTWYIFTVHGTFLL